MPHNIPSHVIDPLVAGPSQTKISQASNLQIHIQEILGATHHTFLQGSYRNDTSISDINDVDIVAVRESTYSGIHSNVQVTSFVTWDTIFSEIEAKLQKQKKYSWKIERGDKCITLVTSAFKADVVPAVQIGPNSKLDPIVVHSFRDGIEKVNHPRTHIINGQNKHARTDSNYKPAVRMFKNWAKNHFTSDDIVSSYHIESLVHNVSDDCFHSNRAGTYILVATEIAELLEKRRSSIFFVPSVCGNEDISANWDVAKRDLFRKQLNDSLYYAYAAYKANTVAEAERQWKKAFNL